MISIAPGPVRLHAGHFPSAFSGAAFVVAYLFCALAGNVITLAPDLGAFLWPPSGLLLAVLVRGLQKRYVTWLSLAFIADMAASLFFFGFPPWLATCIAMGNCLEAAVGAMLLRRWAGGQFKLNDLRSVLALVLIAATGTPLLSTLAGGTAIALHTSQDVWASWRLWWSGDAIGVLIFAPLVLAMPSDTMARATQRLRNNGIEVSLLLLTLLSVSHAAFFYRYPIIFAVLLVVIYAALRFGFVASSVAVGSLTAMAVFYTSNGHGLFVGEWPIGVAQFLLQLFAIVMAITGLIMAALATQVRSTRVRLEDAYKNAERKVQERTAQLKASEANLQKAVRSLIEADRNKDNFMYTLAHELRTPLSTLGSGLSILDGMPPDHRAKAALAMMSRQLAHAVFLIDEVSDLARIKSGRMLLATDKLDFVNVVQLACDSADHWMKEKQQRFTVNVPAEPVFVLGDKSRLMQAALNLLSNANRYTQRGGEITAVLASDQRAASLMIIDNGPGIPEERVPHIFEMYDRADRRDATGLGIGLALVKQIAELHGGRVSVLSIVGEGSTFILRLPLNQT